MTHALIRRTCRLCILRIATFAFMVLGVANSGMADDADTPRNEQATVRRPAAAEQTSLSKGEKSTTSCQGKWKVHRDVSLMDDQEIVAVWLYAEEPIKGWLNTTHRPMLIIRYREGELDCYIDTGCAPDIEWNEPGVSVTFRFDKKEAESTRCGVSTDNDALIFPHTEEFIRRIADAQQLVVRFTPFHANPATMVFNVSGLRTAIEPLEKASGWHLDTKHDRLRRHLAERFAIASDVDVDGLAVRYKQITQSEQRVEADMQRMLESLREELTADPSLGLKITVHGAAELDQSDATTLTGIELVKIIQSALERSSFPKGAAEIVLGKENQPQTASSNNPSSGHPTATAHAMIVFEILIDK